MTTPKKIAAGIVFALVTVVASAAGAAAATSSRTQGRPTSSNGASSLHLTWLGGQSASSEASATLEVTKMAPVPNLAFWALDVSFSDGEQMTGVAHVGLQQIDGGTAVNWGGYDANGVVMPTRSDLPTLRSYSGTHAYSWSTDVRYRLRVFREDNGWWGADVTDLATRTTTKIGSVLGGGDRLMDPRVWTESFAPCETTSRARWSELRPTPTEVQVSYQSFDDGGCTNTDAQADGTAFLQRSGVTRRTAPFVTFRVR